MLSKTTPRLAAALVAVAVLSTTPAIIAATAEDLSRDARQALQTLYAGNATAKRISDGARAVIVFPNVVKAGLEFGGS